jgi:putative oxidoreductase
MATVEHGGSAEPKLVIPALAPFYGWVRELSWLVIRLTAGGVLFVHGWDKITRLGVSGFASGSLARRGIEPSVPLAYLIIFNETVGAICLMLGLFTRVIAAIIAIEFVVITFYVSYPNGFTWTSTGGGWEYPFLWGLVIFAIALRGGGPYSLDRLIGREI